VKDETRRKQERFFIVQVGQVEIVWHEIEVYVKSGSEEKALPRCCGSLGFSGNAGIGKFQHDGFQHAIGSQQNEFVHR
jgi:hypothetical protein